MERAAENEVEKENLKISKIVLTNAESSDILTKLSRAVVPSTANRSRNFEKAGK